MEATSDILRGELERLFSLEDMKKISTDLLGYDPDQVGGTSGKGAFARALAEQCARDGSELALAEAMSISSTETAEPVERVREGRDLGGVTSGDTIGKCTVRKQVGEGETGVVYLADLEGGGRAVVKVIRPVHARNGAAVSSFLTAVRALGRVKGGVGIKEVGRLEDGRPYVSSEFVDGQSLASRVDRVGPMHINEVRPVMTGVLKHLSKLHERRLFHGAVSPGNVFIVRESKKDGTNGDPSGLLGDGGSDRLLGNGPRVAAPEVLRGGVPNAASDVYLAGVTIYYAVAGRMPFESEHAADVFAHHLLTEPDAPSKHAPKGWVNEEVDKVVLKALAKNPSDRYSTPKALIEALGTLEKKKKKEKLDEKAYDKALKSLKKNQNDKNAANFENIIAPAGEWKKGVDAILKIVKDTSDKGKKVSLLARVARIQTTELKDFDNAAKTYDQLLGLDPENAVAQSGLETLKRAAGDHEGLVELLVTRLESSEDMKERLEIYAEAAEVYEEHLGSTENAFFLWHAALSEEPEDTRAREQVERLATTPEMWNEAITSLSEAAQDEEADASDAIKLYTIMGDWYGERLQRPDFAITCYNQALALDPSNETAYDGVLGLYRKSQTWPELAQLLLSRAEQTTNPAQKRDYQTEAGEVIYRKMSDADRAAGVLSSVIESDPSHPEAGKLLEAIYTDQSKWAELTSLLDGRVKSLGGEAKANALARLGGLYEDRLDDSKKALAAYEEALKIDAGSFEALKGLERVYAKGGKMKELLKILETQLKSATTPRQQITINERIGALYEEEFVDHKKALERYEAVIEIEPGHDGANTALARIYRNTQRFEELVTTLDRHAKSSTDEERKVDLLLSATRTLMADVGAPDRGLAYAERALAIHPEHMEALELVARLQAKSGDASAAVAAVDRLAGAEKDSAKRASLFMRAAALAEEAEDRDGAISRYKKALDAEPENAEANAKLRSLYAARGDAHGAAELLRKELERTDGPAAKAKLFAELGDMQLHKLEKPKDAKKSYDEAIKLDPTCTPAARGLGALAFANSDWGTAAHHLEPLLARASEMDEKTARDVCVECGDAFLKLKDYDKAQRAFLNAKAFAPNDREVLERVAAVTFEAGEADEAAELYRDIADKFGDELGEYEEARVFYRRGEASRRAGDFKEAVKLLEKAHKGAPMEPKPLLALASAYEAQSKWDGAIKSLESRLEYVGQGKTDLSPEDDRFETLVRIGNLQLDKKGDRNTAAKTYVKALEIKGDDRNLLTKLMGVYSETKDWSRLIEVILRIAELVDDPKMLSKYYIAAASVAADQLERHDEAADYYAQALEQDPKLDKAFTGLITCQRKAESWEDLAESYESRLKSLGEETPAVERAKLWTELAEVRKEHLDDPEGTVAALQKAQTLDPENRSRLERLSQLFEADPKKNFSSAVDVHQQLLEKSPYRVESYQALRRLYEANGRKDQAWCVCQALHVLKMADPEETKKYKAGRTKSPAEAEEFFNEEMWFNHIIHTRQDPLLTGIFATITPAVVATAARPLSEFKVKPAINAETDDAQMAQMLHYAAGVSQIPLPDVHYRTDDGGGLSTLHTNPPAIGLGRGALAGGPAQALAFVSARHLSYFRGGHYLRQLVPTGSGLRAWLLAAIKTSTPQFPVPAKVDAQVKERMAAISKHILGPQRDQLQSLVTKLLAAAPELDMKKWIAAVDLTADRVGFVLANSLELSCAVIKASPEDSAGVAQKERLKELQLYAASEPYMQLRAKLGIEVS